MDVSISGVTKGVPGRPGELKGYFTEETTGVLLGNTSCGVYGILRDIPYEKIPENCVPVGRKEDVHTGDAYIWCTLTGEEIEKFSVCITELSAENDANFEITVTDPALIEKTGGIVQGMMCVPIVSSSTPSASI